MARDKTPPQSVAVFVRWHLGRGAFAPLTGTDTKAWNAFVYLLELYGSSRSERALEALRACYACTLRGYGEQTDVAEVFRQSIASVLDWSDVPKLWPAIAPASQLTPAALYRPEPRPDCPNPPVTFRRTA